MPLHIFLRIAGMLNYAIAIAVRFLLRIADMHSKLCMSLLAPVATIGPNRERVSARAKTGPCVARHPCKCSGWSSVPYRGSPSSCETARIRLDTRGFAGYQPYNGSDQSLCFALPSFAHRHVVVGILRGVHSAHRERDKWRRIGYGGEQQGDGNACAHPRRPHRQDERGRQFGGIRLAL